MAILTVIIVGQSMEIATWLGVISTLLTALFAFLLRDAYSRLVERIEKLESDKEILAKDLANLGSKLETEMRGVDKTINTVHMSIVDKLDTIKQDLNAARK